MTHSVAPSLFFTSSKASKSSNDSWFPNQLSFTIKYQTHTRALKFPYVRVCVWSDPFVALSKTRKNWEFPISTHSTVSHTHTHTLAFACACVCLIDWLSNKVTKTHRETDCARPFVLFIVVTVSSPSLLSTSFVRSLEKAYTFLIKRMRATELEICMRTRLCVCVYACLCMFCGGNMIKCVIKENVSLAERTFLFQREYYYKHILT